MSDDIAAFIRARLDESEYAATRAADVAHGRGWFHHEGSVGVRRREGSVGHLRRFGSTWIPTHIALHDPAAVLRDVEATRRIVDQITIAVPFLGSADPAYRTALEWILRTLASRWSTHPEYRQEWKP